MDTLFDCALSDFDFQPWHPYASPSNIWFWIIWIWTWQSLTILQTLMPRISHICNLSGPYRLALQDWFSLLLSKIWCLKLVRRKVNSPKKLVITLLEILDLPSWQIQFEIKRFCGEALDHWNHIYFYWCIIYCCLNRIKEVRLWSNKSNLTYIRHLVQWNLSKTVTP